MQLLADQVQRVCIYARAARIAALLPSINASLAEAEVSTPLRAAMYLAQLGHETCDFAFLSEIWGNTPAQSRYEGRADLGNTQPGDGYRYRGRGAIQLTGRANYARAGAALGLDLVEHPELVALPECAFRVAAWFWRTHGLNAFADAGDLEGATRRINGGTNGLLDRHIRYDRACEALGIAANPVVSAVV